MKKLNSPTVTLRNLYGFFAKAFAIVLMVALIGCTSSSTDEDDNTTPPQEQPSNPDNGEDDGSEDDGGSGDNGNDDSGSSGESEDTSNENIGQHVQEINTVIEPLFKECNSIEELSSHIEDIKVIEGVSEAWTTNNALYVDTKSGAKLAWLFTPDDNQEQAEYEEYISESINTIQTRTSEQDHEYIGDADKMDVCIINQQANDESRNWLNTYYNELGNSFPSDAFNVTYINGHELNIYFLKNEFTKYNIIFFITHGGYDGKKHWIMSGTEISPTNKLLVESFYKTVKGDDVAIHSVKETRDEETTIVSYVTFSEDFIKNSIKGDFDNSIIFCTACQSLKGSNILANAFKVRGAKAYLGYNETNYVGKLAGTRFFNALLRGYTIDHAYNNMQNSDKVDPIYSSRLISAIPNADNICIVHPMVKTNANPKIEGTSATLEGVVKEWNGNKLLEGETGFCWSKDNSDPKYNDSDKFAVKIIKASDEKEIQLSHTIKDLESTTQYYYRAYLKINGEYQYGDVMSFTTEEEPDDAYMRAYLIKLYNDTNGDNWKRNDNWCSDKPLDEWYGISYYEEEEEEEERKRLYQIQLYSNNLQGTIDFSGCKSLQYLYCNDNQLTNLDVSGCSKLQKLGCHYNQLVSLNISGCSNLTMINCDYAFNENSNSNVLKATKCISLAYLQCDFNQLTSLDVSGCTVLEDLNCANNKLTSLDVSGCTSLTELYCYDNQLTSLDISDCTSLTELYCYDNQLTSLDVSGCTMLIDLDCADNKLTSLDVSDCTVLEDLWCSDNQLTSLDVSGCTTLISLQCYDNQLTNLYAIGCLELTEIRCNDNQLTTIDVSSCSNLTLLNCDNNKITNINISDCINLKELYCENNKAAAVITQQLYNINIFYYNKRYAYTILSWEIDPNTGHYKYVKWTDNGYGWYYPGEPSNKCHTPPESWTK